MVHIKDLGRWPVNYSLTKFKIREVVIHAAEPDSDKEGIERIIKIMYSGYENVGLDKIEASMTQLNDK